MSDEKLRGCGAWLGATCVLLIVLMLGGMMLLLALSALSAVAR